MEPFWEIGADFSPQLSSQTQFAKISNKKSYRQKTMWKVEKGNHPLANMAVLFVESFSLDSGKNGFSNTDSYNKDGIVHYMF